MLERYDQSELLDLIEGDLDQRAASALRHRLSQHPQAAARVEAILGDREALRAVEEPALPQDFIAAIEPLLTRPMLIETVAEIAPIKPGEFRRQHRRQTQRMRWGRLAAAAVLLLAALGGAWAMIENWGGGGLDRGGDLLAANSSDASRDRTPAQPRANGALEKTARGGSLAGDLLGPGTVHHDLPARSESAMNAALATAEPRNENADRAAAQSEQGQPVILAADFAVVVESTNASVAESAVTGALADLGARAAFVHNFSFREAQQLDQDYRLAHADSTRSGRPAPGHQPRADAGASRPTAPGTTGIQETFITRAEMQQLAERVREQLRVRSESSDSPAGRGPVAADDSPLAPSLEQQLDFSSRGATHTIAVPASELVALIERLTLSDAASGAATTLRMLATHPLNETGASTSASTPAAPAMLVWLTEGPLVRQALQRLTQVRSDAIVLLPVVVK